MKQNYLNKGIVTKLFNWYEFEELVPHFLKLWRVNEEMECSPIAISQWELLFNALKKEELLPTDLHLEITSRWEHASPAIDMNCCVCDFESNRFGPLAWHTTIGEILSMEIYIEKEIYIADDELAGGLFWEISYLKTEEKMNLIQKEISCR